MIFSFSFEGSSGLCYRGLLGKGGTEPSTWLYSRIIQTTANKLTMNHWQ